MYAEIEIAGNCLQLLPSKSIYIKNQKTLLLADIHLGKVNHFRRSGIAVPTQSNDENMENLIALLQKYTPGKVIFLGDLFHSHYNGEWEVFGQMLKYFPATCFELVIGNHDIMSEYQYLKHQLVIHREPLVLNGIVMSHEPLDTFDDDLYNLAGHIHPGVVLRGRGRQGIKLPAFIFTENMGLLPAFGAFTGLAKIRPAKKDKVFVIVEDHIVDVSQPR